MNQSAVISESDIRPEAVGGTDRHRYRGSAAVLPARPLPVSLPAFDTWQVLLVESGHRQRELLSEALGRHVHQVTCVDTGAKALDVYDQADVVLLGPDLPDIDGLEVCRQIRRRGSGIPILMLTARGDAMDRVVGLELGADDYLPKPFEPRELLARLRAVLRRGKGDVGSDVLRFGRLEIDRGADRKSVV